MTDYKYRVYDGETGYAFADVARLQTALLMLDGLRENYPQVTIDEIVPGPAREADTTPKIGDRVRGVGQSIAGGDPTEGVYDEYDTDGFDSYKYGILEDSGVHRWYEAIERV